MTKHPTVPRSYRIKKKTVERISTMADALEISSARVIERMIDYVYEAALKETNPESIEDDIEAFFRGWYALLKRDDDIDPLVEEIITVLAIFVRRKDVIRLAMARLWADTDLDEDQTSFLQREGLLDDPDSIHTFRLCNLKKLSMEYDFEGCDGGFGAMK